MKADSASSIRNTAGDRGPRSLPGIAGTGFICGQVIFIDGGYGAV